jgi:hypothetical protein
MPEKKLLLTDKTQFTEVRAFFDELEDKDRVRARSCEDGVELYVRGSSKWHVFTDLLRLASTVRQDYTAAQTKLFSIFNNASTDPLHNVTDDFKNKLSVMQESTKDQKHDFRAYQLKSFFKKSPVPNGSASYTVKAEPPKKRLQTNASERLDSAWGDKNLSETKKRLIQQTDQKKSAEQRLQMDAEERLDSAWKNQKLCQSDTRSIQQTVQNLVNGRNQSDTPENIAIQAQAKHFLSYLNNQISPCNDTEAFEIFLTALSNQISPNNNFGALDFVAAEQFAFSWKQRPEKDSLGVPDEDTKTAEELLTELASKIIEQSVPSQVNLNAGDVGSAEADLIVIDPHSNYPEYEAMTTPSTSISSSHDAHWFNGDEAVQFHIKDHPGVGSSKSARIDNALAISYNEGSKTIGYSLKLLYKKVGETITTQISSSGKQSGDPYTIHMTILSPSGFEPESPDPTDALEAFAIATLQWLKDHPNLRIKVQLPQGVSEQAMIDVYRKCKYY